ncbi:DNA-binding transcriptional MerR regulator [Sulfitobacter undariae]|uniref:DNA-binding transcriptional MerR regulator n=1 Tax=Sulfitobacter undariae TaxID=1563671 RepID=A0A7W6E419_9RHOB|nr:MerR family transcriptional regulator [Sulfitobacter undariae]MBB3993879.1 DNA-binding transcriptional MerR regulator [Sulfitobacter undariae]
MPKSPDAFRTISEVADWLGIQAHVLRFWESKFTQVKPIKRAGGRRYYRPADMLLLGGIKKLLHEDGFTIKGVQKILREEGMSHVAAMSTPLEDGDVYEEVEAPTPATQPAPEPVSVVLPFEAPKAVAKSVEPAEAESATAPLPVEAEPVRPQEELHTNAAEEISTDVDDHCEAPESTSPIVEAESSSEPEHAAPVTAAEDKDEEVAEVASIEEPLENIRIEASTADDISEAPDASDAETLEDPAQEETDEEIAEIRDASPVNLPLPDPITQIPSTDTAVVADTSDTAPARAESPVHAALSEPTPDAPEEPEQTDIAEPEPQPVSLPAAAKPRDIGMPTVTAEQDIQAELATLAHASRLRSVDSTTARKMAPLLAQLSALRDRMAADTGDAQPK